MTSSDFVIFGESVQNRNLRPPLSMHCSGIWKQNLEMESNNKISKAMKATRLKECSHDAFALSFHRFGCNPPIRNRKVSCHRPYFLILVCLLWPSDLNNGFTVSFCAKTPIGIFWYLLVFFGVFFLTASGAFLATVFVKQGMFGIFWYFLWDVKLSLPRLTCPKNTLGNVSAPFRTLKF